MQDFLRFTLALAVVIFHFKHFAIETALTPVPSDYIPPFYHTLKIAYDHGYHAVWLFFLLSGYMLAGTYHQGSNTKFDYKRFLIKRIARIYPAHLASLCSMAIMSVVVTTAGYSLFITYNDNTMNFALSLVLLNGFGITKDVSFNLPSWSLSLEMLCYTILCIVYASKKGLSYAPLSMICIGIVVVEAASDPNTDNVGNSLIYFFMGCVTRIHYLPALTSRSRPGSVTVLCCGIMSVTSFFLSLSLGLGPQKLVWILISFPLLIITLDLMDTRINKSYERPFKYFGLVSFSIYIWHFPAQAIIYYIFKLVPIFDYGEILSSSFLLLLYLSLSMVLGHISLLTVERYGGNAIRKLCSKPL